jgi:hypothetical protein
VRTLNKHIFNNHRNQDPPENGQRLTGGAGGPVRAQVHPNMVRMNRPYDHSGFSNNPLARKHMAGPNGYHANHLAGQNPALTQNKMKPNQMHSPLALDPVTLMAQMNLQIAACMRQLQSQLQSQIQQQIQTQVQTSTSSPMPATSLLSQHAQLQQIMINNQNAHMQPLRCEHCQITFPDQILYMAHMDMHKRQPYPKGNLFYQVKYYLQMCGCFELLVPRDFSLLNFFSRFNAPAVATFAKTGQSFFFTGETTSATIRLRSYISFKYSLQIIF